MFPRTLLKRVTSSRNYRMLAETTFEYLTTFLLSQSAGIVRAPSQDVAGHTLLSSNTFTPLEAYPEAF